MFRFTMTSDEKLDIINSFLTPDVKKKFTVDELKTIYEKLYACDTRKAMSDTIDFYLTEYADRAK